MAAVRSRLRRIPGKLGRMGRRALGVSRGPAILMYHRIGRDDIDPWGLAVPAERFDEQLAWLKRHRVVLPLAEFARAHQKGKLPRRAIAITFDDGYACNATAAAPLLIAHSLPATIFVTTGPIAEGREFWWDELQQIVFATERTRLDLAVGGQVLPFDLGARRDGELWLHQQPPSNDRQEAFMAIWRALRALEAPQQSAALERLREQAGVPEGARDSHRPMALDEVKALGKTGLIEIGAHSITHAALSEHDEAAQREEIEGSRRACAAIIGRTPTSFAYPFGDYTAATVELVRAAGFEAACTTDMAPVTARSDVMALPRLQVEDWSAPQLAGALSAL
jgi:peptidoglycan/xylan/chitin deacetylase (PgdA/CDA1 family)